MKKIIIFIIVLVSISSFVFATNFAGAKIDIDTFLDFSDSNIFSATCVGVNLYSYNYYYDRPFGSAVEFKVARTENMLGLHLTTDFVYNFIETEKSQIYLCSGLITSIMLKRNYYYFFLGPNLEVGQRTFLTGKFKSFALDYGLKSSYIFQVNKNSVSNSKINFLVPSAYFGLSYKY